MGSRMLTYAGIDNANYLEACTLCSKPLAQNSDIFMYRGNSPFCSQDCRQEQIEIDVATEKKWKISSKKSKETSKKNNKVNMQTETLLVA